MQQLLSAILLSVALLLSGTAVSDADPEAPAKTGSYFIRVLEAAMDYEEEETREEPPAPVKNIATVGSPPVCTVPTARAPRCWPS